MRSCPFFFIFQCYLLAHLFALNGCISSYSELDSRVSSTARVNLLENIVESYANSLRWGYYEEIRQYQRTKSGNWVDFSLRSISHHRVVSYKNLSKLLSQDGINARVVSKIEYYEVDTGILKTKFYDQNWWYDGIRDRWFLGSSIPKLEIPD